MVQRARQASTTPSGKPAYFGAALGSVLAASAAAAQGSAPAKNRVGKSRSQASEKSVMFKPLGVLGKGGPAQGGGSKQTGLAALVEGDHLRMTLFCP